MNFFESLALYLSYPFVRYALIACVLISLCSSLLGVSLVLKRFSFIGDGLSHVAFGAMAIATIMDISNDMLVIMPVTVVAAIILLCAGQNVKIRGDAAIAMLSVSALGIGYLLMNIFSVSGNISGDICNTLFGSTAILTLSLVDVIICVVMSLAVVSIFIVFYNKIFSITFDENFAAATGLNVRLYNFLMAVVTAVIIVLAMKLVGTLLISALIIFPCLCAMRIFKSFKAVIVCATVTSMVCSLLGIIISIFASTPVGSTIVAVDLITFLGFCLVGRLCRLSHRQF